jgi:hypothetical protein
MADLPLDSSALPVVLVGASSTGVPTTPAAVDSSGNQQVIVNNTNANPVPVTFVSSGAADVVGSGTLTAVAQSVTVTVGTGQSEWALELSGTFRAGSNVIFEGSVNGTDWFALNGRQTGTVNTVLVNNTNGGSGPYLFRGNLAGMSQFRARCTAFQTGDSITVSVRASSGIGAVFLNASIPAGNNLIGTVARPSAYTSGTISALNTGVQLTLLEGQSAWDVYISGTFSVGSTLWFQGSLNGTDWFNLNGRRSGDTSTNATTTTLSAQVSGGPGPLGGNPSNWRGNLASIIYFRVYSSAFQAGDSVTVQISTSAAVGTVFLNASLPAGADIIGTVAGTYKTGTQNGLTNGQQSELLMDPRGALITGPSLDSPTVDVMNRLRVASTQVLGAYCFVNTLHNQSFNTATTGAGSITLNTNLAATVLSTTTASGDTAIKQTKRYYRYTPGESHRVSISSIVGAATTNVTKRWGFFEANDGIFWQQTGAGMGVAIRSSTSGSVVDTVTAQSSWNLDKLDGTGSSGQTLDPTKQNVFIIEYTWHGSARVRYGIFIQGAIVYVHQNLVSNLYSAPYMRTPYLPMRMEITNTGAVASATSFDISCVCAIKESLDPLFVPYNFSKSSGRTGVQVQSTVIPLLSIAPGLTFNGLTNRVITNPTRCQILTNQQPVLCQIIVNGTLTGSSFSAVNSTYSSTSFDMSATAITGGIVLAEFYVDALGSQEVDLTNYGDAALLGLNITGSTAETLTIAAVSVAGNSTTWANVQWEEFQ